MSDESSESSRPKPTVFVSYASEDRQAARLIGEALPAYGLEVWLDQSELGGGDAWDQKIRRQIRECDYFMPLVSAQTEARHEGYFRREWRLAVERTLDMADDYLFLLPVVIDDTIESRARVPEKFLSVQWLRLPGGHPTPALEALCHRLVSGEEPASSASRTSPARPVGAAHPSPQPPPSAPSAPSAPRPFPKEEEGQKVRFWFEVLGWAFASGWAIFKRWPRWVRILVIVWLALTLMNRGCSDTDHPSSSSLSASDEKKLKQIAQQFKGGASKADLTKLATQVASQFSAGDDDNVPNHPAVLAIPFAAPQGDAAAQGVADAAFAQVYGRMAIAHRGKVGLANDPLPGCSLASVLAQARENKSSYAVCGSIDTQQSDQTLTIQLADIGKGTVLWSKSYPVAGADAATIAAEASSKVPSLDDD